MRRDRRALKTIRLALSLVWVSGRSQVIFIIESRALSRRRASPDSSSLVCTLLDMLADSDHVDAGELAPSLVLLGVLLMVSAISQAIAGELRTPLSEQARRGTMNEILDVATEVDLEDLRGLRLPRSPATGPPAAGGQSAAVVFGIVTIVSTLVVNRRGRGAVHGAPILLPIAIMATCRRRRQRAQQPAPATSSSSSSPSCSVIAPTWST